MINDQMLQQSTILAGALTTQILQILSVIPNVYQTFNPTRIFSNMSTWTVLFDKNNHIFPYERNIENRAHFPN